MKQLIAAIGFIVLGSFASAAHADAFKSPKECVGGKRVTDRQQRAGTVVKMVNDNLCQVHIDETGKDEYFIFWMLTEAGNSPQPTVKLVNGTYECYANGQYTFMDMQVTSATTYKTDGGSGSFRLEAGNKLVFDNGPFANTTAKIDKGPSILLSTNGGSFYGTSCELKK